MTQLERIEKTTKIFEKAHEKSVSLNDIFNEVQSVMDEYLNEHLSQCSALEEAFFVFSLESRLQHYKKELESHPQLMMIYILLNESEQISKAEECKFPNLFGRKGGNDD